MTRPKRSADGRPATRKATGADLALQYLEAVVAGDVSPNQQRVAAARAILSVARANARASPTYLPPKARAERDASDAERKQREDWEAKARAIRAKHSMKG